jgi:hypothetical protein
VRCYLVAERAADISTLQQVLDAKGIEVVMPGRGFGDLSRRGRLSWLPEVDFLCVVFSKRLDSSTPPAMYVDIGVAIGSGMPTLVIVEPPRVADSVLAPLHVVQVPLGSAPALSLQVKSFLKSMGQTRPQLIDQRRPDADMLQAIKQELGALSEVARGDINSAYQRFEGIAVRLLEAAGALTEGASHGGDQGFDIAAWVPGTEAVLPGPLLIEIKLVRGSILGRQFDQLQNAVARRNASFGLLLYYPLSGQPVRLPSGHWPMVMAFEMGDLLKSLTGRSLAQVILNSRNALVHGRKPE